MATNNNQEPQCTIAREALMLARKAARLLGGLMAAGAMLGMAAFAQAQDNDKKIKIAVIFDPNRPLAGRGSGLQNHVRHNQPGHYAQTLGGGHHSEAIYYPH